jgi:hypothetical protein
MRLSMSADEASLKDFATPFINSCTAGQFGGTLIPEPASQPQRIKLPLLIGGFPLLITSTITKKTNRNCADIHAATPVAWERIADQAGLCTTIGACFMECIP